MILFHWQDFSPRRARLVVLFGAGLVGGAIKDQLCRHNKALNWRQMDFSWRDREAQAAQLRLLNQTIGEILPQSTDAQLDAVWSAGRGGFANSEETFAEEMRSFEAVLDFVAGIANAGVISPVRFHLVSSAGGLFEGLRNVQRETPPCPLRPYGRAKLQQEERLRQSESSLVRMIYRPSSVYGFGAIGGRIGLVTSLLTHSLRNSTATIFGNSATIRDYILADDVGDFIARQILAPSASTIPFLLVSGKPTSMFEMIYQVERVAQKHISATYVLGDSNTRDNSFVMSARPSNWNVTSLETGIRLVARRMMNSLLIRPVAQ